MNRLHQLVLFTNSFSLGVLLPLFNLILLEKGSTLQTLPLLMALYSITVLCTELPSGICADMFGRKVVFLLACVFQIISFMLLAAGNNLIWLIFALVFFGLGRAFSSGSIDALIIDQAIDQHGDGCIAKVTARMALLDGTGLAAGSIAGGIIADITGTYLINVLLRLALTVLIFFLCLVFIQEDRRHLIKEHTSLLGHLRQGKQVLTSSPVFIAVFIGIFFVGFLLSSIETYWQPAFMQIHTVQNSTWMLGFITFLGFFAVILGNSVAQRLLEKFKNWFNVYNVFRISIAACIIIFSLQKRNGGFVAWFFMIYLLLGAGNVAENAILNKFTPSHVRASMLSLNSFTVQIGALCSSIFSSVLIMRLQFTGIWLFAGGILGAYAVIVAVITRKPIKDVENIQSSSSS